MSLLNRAAVLIAALGFALIGYGPASASADDGNSYEIAAQLRYSPGGTIPLRVGRWDAGGDKGFGSTKIVLKHNIRSVEAMEYVTRSPNRHHIGGTSYRHLSFANEVTCTHEKCVVTDQVEVRMTINERVLRDGQAFGVVTMYCEGFAGSCPDWATEALVAGNAGLPNFGTASVADRRWTVHHMRSHFPLDVNVLSEVPRVQRQVEAANVIAPAPMTSKG